MTYKKQIAYLNDVIDILYPVGSVYSSVKEISPSILFGGDWIPITESTTYYSWYRTA